jgi:glutathione S-transferase
MRGRYPYAHAPMRLKLTCPRIASVRRGRERDVDEGPLVRRVRVAAAVTRADAARDLRRAHGSGAQDRRREGLRLADDHAPLEELAPKPPLFPADAEARARVEDAERWGDEVFQPIARERVWVGIKRSPAAMVSYSENSTLRLPAPAIRLSAPLIARLAARLNRTNDGVARSDLVALPAQLDKIDAWIADGTIGDSEYPNAADLQLASTIPTDADVCRRAAADRGPAVCRAGDAAVPADGRRTPGRIAASCLRADDRPGRGRE